ncbi:MAG TPA: molybdopterin cofactor-binding domain-containing protein, partial [Myxococcaceae bacterium]|nr:molybdopterin cofactor-binding domain-containing protein [Myxococcaceae bacterium]
MPTSPLGQNLSHESGLRHTSGEALYTDDLPAPRGMLHGYPVVSPHPHARILRRDAARALAMPGVHAVLFAADVPGENQIGAVARDEPLLAEDVVQAEGQVVALVLAESRDEARKAAAAVDVGYEPLPALLDIREAIAVGSFHQHPVVNPHVMQRGDVEGALAKAALVLTGEVENGGQDHFYLETHVCLALPEEGGNLRLISSTQHPTEVQAKVAELLHRARHTVVVEVPRMGGGFGGKETQGAHWAALAALGAVKTDRPVKVWLNRDQDMVQTGKRHPFLTRYEAGFDRDGALVALRAFVYANAGWTLDLSHSICDRALFHLANAYWIPNLRFEGWLAKTNVASNTAFRGFGGPQGMLVIEELMNLAAARLGLDPAEIRRRNYVGAPGRDRTPYDQQITDPRMGRIHDELLASSDYVKRRAEIDACNARNEFVKRGIGYMPVQFGISFTFSTLNQSGALVLIFADGSVQLNHGGTEMGQGLHTKMLAIAAHELGVPVSSIRVMTTSTDKVPNTSATAASSGSDLNGAAIVEACRTLVARMRPVAAKELGQPDAAEDVVFEGGRVFLRSHPAKGITFAQVAQAAWFAQVSLASTGFYRVPGIAYDARSGKGKPFHYFAYGASVVEVELSTLTGEHRLRRVDILHDVGSSLVPNIDVGQVEGAFIQG